MKKYSEYMDGVTVSDTLHEKLKNLEKPEKKPWAWRKYGAAAAALVLVLGVGAWGLTLYPSEEADAPQTEMTEPALEPAPAPMPDSPGMEMMGGYEVIYGEVAAYYLLPRIKYGEAESASADIALPEGVKCRDLTEKELLALLGGETNLTDHLDWSDYTVHAYAMVWPDDSLWLLCIGGTRGDSGYEHFTLEVMPGALPPTCIVYGESVSNNIWEREVAASGYDGKYASSRRVSFMDGDYGYRFDITGEDVARIEEMSSRLVRWIIVGDGLTLEEADNSGTLYGENGEVNTPAYDPSATPTPPAEP